MPSRLSFRMRRIFAQRDEAARGRYLKSSGSSGTILRKAHQIGVDRKMTLELYKPKPEDLWFRQAMMADEATMAYNRAWGGTIPFPEEAWADWYAHWLIHHEDKRYYRYLKDGSGQFVGEIAYHFDEEGICLADVIIHAKFRGRGFGRRALDLLCSAAKERGVRQLWDDIAIDNPAIGLFLERGFVEDHRSVSQVYLKKDL